MYDGRANTGRNIHAVLKGTEEAASLSVVSVYPSCDPYRGIINITEDGRCPVELSRMLCTGNGPFTDTPSEMKGDMVQ